MITGSGDIKTYPKEELSIDISGSGDILYRGDPTVTQKVSGRGKIKRI